MRTKAADHETQRQRIIQQAVRAFAQIGYASASMAELAKACDVSKATLYHYFASKDAILFAAADQYTQRLLAILNELRLRHSAGPEHVHAMVRALCTDYAAHQDQQMSLLFDVKHLPAEQLAQIKRQERAVVHLVAECLHNAYPQALAHEHSMLTVMSLLGMLNFSFAWYRPHGHLNADQWAQRVIQLWDRALLLNAPESTPLPPLQ
jgi:AcrR family transcriptional regulator